MNEERETETVAGVVSGIIEKGPGKWQVLVRPDGSQYDRKLWTKSETTHGQASALIGQRAAFVCNASYWDGPNGQVRSLWIDHLADPGGQPAAPSPVAASAPPSGSSGSGRDDTRVSIERQTALKAAVELWAARGGWDPGVDVAGVVLDTAARFAVFLASGAARSVDDPDIPF